MRVKSGGGRIEGMRIGGEGCNADEVGMNESGGVDERSARSHGVVFVVGRVVGGRFAKDVKGDKLCCD